MRFRDIANQVLPYIVQNLGELQADPNTLHGPEIDRLIEDRPKTIFRLPHVFHRELLKANPITIVINITHDAEKRNVLRQPELSLLLALRTVRLSFEGKLAIQQPVSSLVAFDASIFDQCDASRLKIVIRFFPKTTCLSGVKLMNYLILTHFFSRVPPNATLAFDFTSQNGTPKGLVRHAFWRTQIPLEYSLQGSLCEQCEAICQHKIHFIEAEWRVDGVPVIANFCHYVLGIAPSQILHLVTPTLELEFHIAEDKLTDMDRGRLLLSMIKASIPIHGKLLKHWKDRGLSSQQLAEYFPGSFGTRLLCVRCDSRMTGTLMCFSVEGADREVEQREEEEGKNVGGEMEGGGNEEGGKEEAEKEQGRDE